MIAALAAMYWFGESRGGYLHFRTAAKLERINRALAAQSSANAKLRLRVSFLEHALQLAEQSASVNKKNMIEQQSRFDALKRRLAFYKGLVKPSATGSAVRIAGLQVLPDGASREYRFQIVLVRADNASKKPLHGTCSVTVRGQMGGRERRLPLRQVAANTPDPLRFNLRYFANLAGTLRLPSGFTPQRIEVEVKVRGKGKVTASYNWPVFRG